MSFRLIHLTHGKDADVEISEGEFAAIKDARDVIWAALGSEQKFDLMVENYYEFEREILDLSLQHSLALIRPWDDYAHDRQRVERRLGNLTFATRLLLDQMNHDAVFLLGRNSSASQELKSVQATEGEQLPHRTLLALRDRIQHQSFPEIGITYHSGWEGDEGGEGPPRRLHGWLDLQLKVSDLEEGKRPGDKRLEKLVDDLSKLGDAIDLLDFVRKHVESVARIHARFLKLIDGRLVAAESLISESIERWRRATGGEGTLLAAARFGDNGGIEEEVHLFEEPIRYRRALRKKNGGLASISKRFVSSASRTLMPAKRGR